MTAEPISSAQKYQGRKVVRQTGASEVVYGMGLIGAWVYYISHATTLLIGLLGILKGIFWPAMLVYEALKFMNM
jgi:hypothetical protein